MPDDVIQDLRRLSAGDQIKLTINGEEYSGVVSESYTEPVEYHQGLPIEGGLSVGFEADNETFDARELSQHTISIMASNPRRNVWEEPSAAVWAPVVEDGEIIRDDWRELGVVEEVEE